MGQVWECTVLLGGVLIRVPYHECLMLVLCCLHGDVIMSEYIALHCMLRPLVTTAEFLFAQWMLTILTCQNGFTMLVEMCRPNIWLRWCRHYSFWLLIWIGFLVFIHHVVTEVDTVFATVHCFFTGCAVPWFCVVFNVDFAIRMCLIVGKTACF